MLNSTYLTELFSENSDGHFRRRWIILSPNGTILAYSRPCNMRTLRKNCWVALTAWQEDQVQRHGDASLVDGDDDDDNDEASQTLALACEDCNLIIRQLPCRLLLVLEGGIPPRQRAAPLRTTTQQADEDSSVLHDNHVDSSLGSPAPSTTESSTSNHSVVVLQRQKFDNFAAAVNEDIESSGFQIPDDSSAKLF